MCVQKKGLQFFLWFQHKCTKPKLGSHSKQLHTRVAIKSGYWTPTTAANWPCLAGWANCQRSDPTHNINSLHKRQHEVVNEAEPVRMQYARFLLQVKLSRCQAYFRDCRTAASMRGLHIQITLLLIQLFMLSLSIKVAEYIGGSIIRFPRQHYEGKVIT